MTEPTELEKNLARRDVLAWVAIVLLAVAMLVHALAYLRYVKSARSNPKAVSTMTTHGFQSGALTLRSMAMSRRESLIDASSRAASCSSLPGAKASIRECNSASGSFSSFLPMPADPTGLEISRNPKPTKKAA